MFKHYLTDSMPVAAWMLEDTAPYEECGGLGYSAGLKSGSDTPTRSVPLTSGAISSPVFSRQSIGEFDCPLFNQGLEDRSFALSATVYPIRTLNQSEQQILSHDGQYDGLALNGNVIKFSTKYVNTGEAACTYVMPHDKSLHIVGVHTAEKNLLYVNGVLVSTVVITQEQREDTFISTTQKLYCGGSVGDSKIAVQAVAIHNYLSASQIRTLYSAMKRATNQFEIYSKYRGQNLSLDALNGSTYFDVTLDTREDFRSCLLNNVAVTSSGVVSRQISGVPQAGYLETSFPLDIQGVSNIYGVSVLWSGVGVTVQASLDNGTTWTQLENSKLIPSISSGYATAGKTLIIRVNLPANNTDECLKSLSVTGFVNNLFSNPHYRLVSSNHPCVLRKNIHPINYDETNGLLMPPGVLSIGPDTSDDPDTVKTLELWIKPLAGNINISVSGTTYRNGYADSSLPRGEWSLVHIVAPTSITGSITVQGNCIIGSAALYPELTASEVESIFKCYTGVPRITISESSTLSISEPVQFVNFYTHDWTIKSG